MTTLRANSGADVRPDPAQRPRRAWHPLDLFADHAMARGVFGVSWRSPPSASA